MSMSSGNRFFICLYLKDGEAIGHQGGYKNEFPAQMTRKKKGTSDDPAPKVKRSGLEEISDQFIHTMMGYLEYVPMILQMTPMISHRMVTRSLKSFLEKNCISSKRETDRIIYEFPRHTVAAIRRFEENLSAASATSRALPRMLTVGLVASLEYSLNLVMKEIAATHPERIFGEEKKLSVREVLQFQSIEEIRESVINDEIDKAQRQNFESQIDWIVDKAKMEPFTSKYPDWSRMIELFERRNLFVHANGIVNEHYLGAIRKHKTPGDKEPALGDELHAGPKYFTASVHRVIHFGAMLLQVVWRKIAPNETEAADRSLADLGYELIARGQYDLAIRILEFARELRNVSEEAIRRMNVINLANAYKLSGNEKKSLEILDAVDWSAVGPEFKISVLAVKGDVDGVLRLMTRIGDKGDIRAEDYTHWPVFYSVRSDPKFVDCFKEIFGVDYLPSAKKHAGIAQVLAWIEEQDLAGDEEESSPLIEDGVQLQPKHPE